MGIFDFTYAVLWGLVLLQALVLREMLRETVWLERLVQGFGRKTENLPAGTPAPEFELPVLGEGRTLGPSDLAGDESILLFVEPSAAVSPAYASLDDGIHGLWHKVDGRLYMVCRGSEEECRRFVADRPFRVPVLVDERGRLGTAFRISVTPNAVRLDADVRVASYGRPISAEEAQAAAEAYKARQARSTGAPVLEMPATEGGG